MLFGSQLDAIGLGCTHGSFCLSAAFGMGPEIPALQLGSMSLALACWGLLRTPVLCPVLCSEPASSHVATQSTLSAEMLSIFSL